jgi:hypothetical protein
VCWFKLAGYGKLGDRIRDHKLINGLVKQFMVAMERDAKAAQQGAAGSGDALKELLLSVEGLEESDRARYQQSLAAARVTVEQLGSMPPAQLMLVQNDTKIPSGILLRISEAAAALAAAAAAAETETETAAGAETAG